MHTRQAAQAPLGGIAAQQAAEAALTAAAGWGVVTEVREAATAVA